MFIYSKEQISNCTPSYRSSLGKSVARMKCTKILTIQNLFVISVHLIKKEWQGEPSPRPRCLDEQRCERDDQPRVGTRSGCRHETEIRRRYSSTTRYQPKRPDSADQMLSSLERAFKSYLITNNKSLTTIIVFEEVLEEAEPLGQSLLGKSGLGSILNMCVQCKSISICRQSQDLHLWRCAHECEHR